MLTLRLVALPLDSVRGIYTVGGRPDSLPERMRYLHPSALPLWEKIRRYVRVSDMVRSPEASLAAKAAGRKAKAPGYSGHNFGLSIDIDVDWCLRDSPGWWPNKAQLDAWMAERGWFCHRSDHKRGSENWHYNALGTGTRTGTSAQALEARIQALYSLSFRPLSGCEEQELLGKLRLYNGEIDGKVGPLTKAARAVFCKAWAVSAGTTRYWRTLAYVSCDRQIENP